MDPGGDWNPGWGVGIQWIFFTSDFPGEVFLEWTFPKAGDDGRWSTLGKLGRNSNFLQLGQFSVGTCTVQLVTWTRPPFFTDVFSVWVFFCPSKSKKPWPSFWPIHRFQLDSFHVFWGDPNRHRASQQKHPCEETLSQCGEGKMLGSTRWAWWCYTAVG